MRVLVLRKSGVGLFSFVMAITLVALCQPIAVAFTLFEYFFFLSGSFKIRSTSLLYSCFLDGGHQFQSILCAKEPDDVSCKVFLLFCVVTTSFCFNFGVRDRGYVSSKVVIRLLLDVRGKSFWSTTFAFFSKAANIYTNFCTKLLTTLFLFSKLICPRSLEL